MKLRIAAIILILIIGFMPTYTQHKMDTVKVVLSTSMGDMTVALFAKKAPLTVRNFLAYVDSGFYAGTIFHRVVPGFVIQGGGFTSEMERKPTLPPIENEASNGLMNLRGTLSMARTNNPNSATSQFFINLIDNPRLDYGPTPGYAVFGEVIEGMEIVDKIASVSTETRGMFQNVPKEPVVIISAIRK